MTTVTYDREPDRRGGQGIWFWLLAALVVLLALGIAVVAVKPDFLQDLSTWMMASEPSQWLANRYEWVVPSFQSLHIVAIGIIVGSIFLIAGKVLGVSGSSMTVRETSRRYGPWLWLALLVLLISGGVLTVTEPERQFMTLSFRVKMLLVVGLALIALTFQISVARMADAWDTQVRRRFSVKLATIGVLLMVLVIIFLGRFIAFDPNIFGCASPFPRALQDCSVEATN